MSSLIFTLKFHVPTIGLNMVINLQLISGLRGKAIGMYYAAKGKQRKKEMEMKNRKTIHMDEGQIGELNQALCDAQTNLTDESTSAKSHEVEEYLEFQETLSEMQELLDVSCSDTWLDLDTKTNENNPLNKRLLEELQDKTENEKYNKMLEFRKKLPAFDKRDELLNLLNKEQVIVISGETGCGKTTQVPQFILDDAISQNKGLQCRIVCTQPRRISAISVAERVAAERAERCGEGNSCGYQIRLDSKLPRSHACILYCTTGILLQWLKSDSKLDRVSHLILDEIHERDIQSDFLITIVKDIIKVRKDLKIILMSATLNAQLFSEYFNHCPTFHIPGFTYPVRSMFLEEILDFTKYSPPREAWEFGDEVRRFCNRDMKRHKSLRFMNKQDINPNFLHKWDQYVDSTLRQTISEPCIDKLFAMHAYSQNKIDTELIGATIKYIIAEQPKGTILVFVPGWMEIKAVNEELLKDRQFASPKFLIIPLHSLMPTTSQRQVFERPPEGVTKIVIATNIAETSITIDDIVHVIDSGKIKLTEFDHRTNMGTLQMKWVSHANAKQRRGRAGRVQEGFCYHLYSKHQQQQFVDFFLPEMLRTPLDQLCLQIRVMQLGKVDEFLSKVMEPPDSDAIALSIRKLVGLSAMDTEQNLTPLGYHLSKLPVEPQIGKMILMAAIFSCLDPVLTIAASLSFKDPFVIPLGKEHDANRQRKKLANGYNSDHVMLLNAFNGWKDAKYYGYREESDYCWENFLSQSTLKMLDDMKSQFARHLHDIGFAPSSNSKDPAMNKLSENMKVVLAIVCAGLYPNICKLNPVGNPKVPVKLSTKTERKLEFHPKSVNYGAAANRFNEQWLCYYLKMKTSSIFVFDASEITAFPLLFFGGNIASYYDEEMQGDVIAVDEWIVFKSKPHIAKLVKELRGALDEILRQKIQNPDITILTKDDASGKVLSAIVDLITTE